MPQIPSNNSYANDSYKKSTNIIPVKGTMNVIEDITDDDISVTSPTLSTRSPVKDPKDYFNRSAPNDNKLSNNNVSKLIKLIVIKNLISCNSGQQWRGY